MAYGIPGGKDLDVLSPSGLEWLTHVSFDQQLLDSLDQAFDRANSQSGNDFDELSFSLSEGYAKVLGFGEDRMVKNLIVRIFDHVGYHCSGHHFFLILKKIAEDVATGMDFDLNSIPDIDLNASDES